MTTPTTHAVNATIATVDALGKDYDAKHDGGRRHFEIDRIPGKGPASWTAAWRNGYHDPHAVTATRADPFGAISAIVDILLGGTT